MKKKFMWSFPWLICVMVACGTEYLGNPDSGAEGNAQGETDGAPGAEISDSADGSVSDSFNLDQDMNYPSWMKFSILASTLQSYEPRVICNVSPTCMVYMTLDLSVFSELGPMPYKQAMGVLGRKDSTVIVSIPMPDRGNAVQVVILGEWIGENLPGANDRVECIEETCWVYQTTDMVNLTQMDVVPLGRLMGILGMKDDVFFVSIPMPDRGNAVQAIRLSEGWFFHTNILNYPSHGLTPFEVAGVTEVLKSYPSSFQSMSGLSAFRYDPAAPNAYHVRNGSNEIIIDPNTRKDKSIKYVASHELGHVWSFTFGNANWLGYGKYIGSVYAESGGSFEKCFPCDAGISKITDCYAAGNALAALSEAGILPESWVKKMGGFDEDFAETVATYFGFRKSTWVDENLKPCNPTNRYQWIRDNIK